MLVRSVHAAVSATSAPDARIHTVTDARIMLVYAPDSRDLLNCVRCTCAQFYFGYILLLYKFILMFYGVMLALRVRSAKSDLSESKYITLAIYNTAAAAVVGGYLFLFSELDEEAKYAAFGVCTFLVFTISPTIMIAPRCVSLNSWPTVIAACPPHADDAVVLAFASASCGSSDCSFIVHVVDY